MATLTRGFHPPAGPAGGQRGLGPREVKPSEAGNSPRPGRGGAHVGWLSCDARLCNLAPSPPQNWAARADPESAAPSSRCFRVSARASGVRAARLVGAPLVSGEEVGGRFVPKENSNVGGP